MLYNYKETPKVGTYEEGGTYDVVRDTPLKEDVSNLDVEKAYRAEATETIVETVKESFEWETSTELEIEIDKALEADLEELTDKLMEYYYDSAEYFQFRQTNYLPYPYGESTMVFEDYEVFEGLFKHSQFYGDFQAGLSVEYTYLRIKPGYIDLYDPKVVKGTKIGNYIESVKEAKELIAARVKETVKCETYTELGIVKALWEELEEEVSSLISSKEVKVA